MAENKYGKYVKKLKFREGGHGGYRQVAGISGKPFSLDFYIEYGACQSAGAMGGEHPGRHRHDFDQVMLWLGTDTDNIGDLGAEVELCLGEEAEKYMITSSTAVGVPRGVPHFPAHINSMGRRFVFMTVSGAPKCDMIKLPAEKDILENTPIASWNARHRDKIIPLAFTRKGAWTYGPKNRDDSGGHLAFIHGRDPAFDFLIMCESLKKAPYRFGPDPDNPHVHPKPEILFFIGTDADDLTRLGGEAEIYLGKKNEMERYVITEPSAVVIPGGVAHCPLVITKVDRPFYLTDVRPFGSEPPAAGKL